MSECCEVGYSATLARAHVHNFIGSENRGLLFIAFQVPIVHLEAPLYPESE